jgi:hypothetical protein
LQPEIFDAHKWRGEANRIITNDTSLDQFLVQVGPFEGETAVVDVLAAYQFSVMWAEKNPNRDYAEFHSILLKKSPITAAECIEAAGKTADLSARATLLSMAQKWL